MIIGYLNREEIQALLDAPEVGSRHGLRDRAMLHLAFAGGLRVWLKVRSETKTIELFLNARGDPMTRSGFEYILAKHVRTASTKQPSLTKKRVSPHSLRHSCAMHTLQATGDIRKVALWLGHARIQSTEVYVRADPTEKLAALASLAPPTLRRGHFRPPDKLLAMLRPER